MQELGESIVIQTAKQANGNIPHHKCHAQFMNGGLLGDRELSALLFPWVQILSCPRVHTSLGVWSCGWVLQNFQSPWVQCSMIAALGLTVNRWLGGEKVDLYIVFFCIVIISIINTIISGTISIYSVALLNCHYLNQWVLLFFHFPPHPSRERGAVSECVGS